MGWWITGLSLTLLVGIGLSHARADWGHISVNCVDGWIRLICRYLHGIKPEVKLNLPDSGSAIVVANHVSGLDPLLLITASRRPLRFLMATEEYYRPGLHWLFRLAGCIPVDRDSRPEQALRQARRALEKGEVLALFPHGKIHLDSDPPRPIKAGVIRLAAWSGAEVFPVRIDGVRAEGKLILASFVPDCVTLTLHCAVQVTEANCHDSLEQIRRKIETPAGSSR